MARVAAFFVSGFVLYDEAALERARLNDGKLLLVTNVADLKPVEVVQVHIHPVHRDCHWGVLRETDAASDIGGVNEAWAEILRGDESSSRV